MSADTPVAPTTVGTQGAPTTAASRVETWAGVTTAAEATAPRPPHGPLAAPRRGRGTPRPYTNGPRGDTKERPIPSGSDAPPKTATPALPSFLLLDPPCSSQSRPALKGLPT